MPPSPAPAPPARRGGIYVAVLGVSAVVAIIGLASLATVRSQRLASSGEADMEKARLYAESAVELGAQLIASDASWRSNRSVGAWFSGRQIGDGTFSLNASDAVDSNLSNRPYDPLVLTGYGCKGIAQQIVQATLVPVGKPIDALKMAVHTQGQLRVNSGVSFKVTGAPASTNTNLRNDGAIVGSAECTTSSGSGSQTGTLTLLAPTKAMPPSGILAMYTALGTTLGVSSGTLDKIALGPGYNPWLSTATNADGVYVINLSSDMTIQNSHICGTLVVIGSGFTLTFAGNVFIHPARPDFPSIITNASVTFKYTSGASTLSEAALGVNLNPGGVPYQGVTNSTLTDSFPSEIQGLVHVLTNSVVLDQTSRIRGALICESTASSDAIRVINNAEIVYDPTLYSSPPMGYTKSVSMVVSPGSWKQVVLP